VVQPELASRVATLRNSIYRLGGCLISTVLHIPFISMDDGTVIAAVADDITLEPG